MDLSQLRTFREIAETLNFTRAAARLNLTQSAVSHQMRGLEQELGEPLFVRSKRGVRLTEAGELLRGDAVQLLDLSENLRERFRRRGRQLEGRVRVAAATQAFVHLFAPLFETFMREHAGVALTFRTTVGTDQTISDLLNGTVDVGFASLPVYSPGLKVARLFEDELVLVTAPLPIFSARREVALEELANERFILFERGASIRRAADELFTRTGFMPQRTLESNDTAFIKLMVERGLGVSLLPAWAARDELIAGRLMGLRLAGQQLQRSVAIVSLDRFQAAPTRAFLEFVLARRDELRRAAAADPDAFAPVPAPAPEPEASPTGRKRRAG